MTKIIYLISMSVLLLLSGSIMAQSKKNTPKSAPGSTLDRMTKELHLTDPQIDSLRPILEEQNNISQKLRTTTVNSDEYLQMQENYSNLALRVDQILTPDQLKLRESNRKIKMQQQILARQVKQDGKNEKEYKDSKDKTQK